MSIVKRGVFELTPNEEEIISKLRGLKLSMMAEEFKRQVLDPNEDIKPFDERVENMINAELDSRTSKKINRLIKKSGLKYPQASLDEKIYEPDRELNTPLIEDLAKCNWLEQSKNLIITGPSGTGKTYLCNAFGVLAISHFKSVYYWRANLLLQELKCKDLKEDLMHFHNELAYCDLLIIDDFGLMELSKEHCRYLLDILDAREGKHPTIIASQFPVSNWYNLFKDMTFADACLDRIANVSYRLEMKGSSLRKG